MATNGVLDFQSTNKLIFRGTSANVVIDTQNLSLGVGHQGEGAPEARLSVIGNDNLSGTPNNAIASFRATTTTPGTNDAGVVIGSINGNTPYIADVSTASLGLSFYTQNALRMRIDSSGNVGVGTTTTPKATLHNNGDFFIAANSDSWTSTTGKGLYIRYSTNLGQDATYIQSITRSASPTAYHPMHMYGSKFSFSEGKIGIREQDPDAWLHNNGDFFIAANSENWTSTTGKGLYIRYSTTGGQDATYIQSITRSASPTAYHPMHIYGSKFSFNQGNVGVGIQDPPARLSVATSGACSRGAEWSSTDFVVSGFNGSTTGRSLGVAIGTSHGESASGNGSIWCLRPALSWNDLYFQCRNFYILNVGGYSYTESSTQITSDDRLKSEEEYLENALSTIMKLKPQKYRKAPFLPNDPRKEMTENMKEMPKDLSKIEAGLIVQDIWYDAPELRYLISLGKDANPSDTKPTDPDPSDPAQDPDYSSWGTTTSHLDYGGINIYLIKAVQELTLRNDALEARIAALENNISS